MKNALFFKLFFPSLSFSDDDLPYSGGSHCDEDRLMSNDISLKKISGIFKHEANGFNPVKRRKQVRHFLRVIFVIVYEQKLR